MQVPCEIILPLFEGYCRKNDMDGREIVATISGVPVKLKIAANNTTQMKGFMHEDEPEDDRGILFLYDNEIPLQFWMKNVNFPLDILFFDSNMNLINNYTMDSYNGETDVDLKRYNSERPAQYAVELKSGWCNKNLKQDCKLKF
jgi:uncharacterized membrane protein (UPF0127 family)